jgi:hypothetical protein
MNPPDLAVVAILDRAARLTLEEATALDAAVRAQANLAMLAAEVIAEHRRWLNSWAMFDHWSHPSLEMAEARQRVAVALGGSTAPIAYVALEPDDGSVRWGASTAAACAVLAIGRARYSVEMPPQLGEPWSQVTEATSAGRSPHT